MNIVVDQPSVNPAAASLAKMPAMPAPASSMTSQALEAARSQGMLNPPRAPVSVPSPRAKLPTDAEIYALVLIAESTPLSSQSPTKPAVMSFDRFRPRR